jgi:tRNA threonylcarbamoyladenosine biosynthesis protein TsaB
MQGFAESLHHLNLLAFDTSTETMSVAVMGAAASPLDHTAAGGAQASTTLIPAIQQLLSTAGLRLPELDAIVFGCGPGSFTGLRTACSVAQGLAFGAGIPVLPIETLMAVAEEARRRTGTERVVAVLDARMDEVYWAAYEYRAGLWQRHGEISLGRPESVTVGAGWDVAGNALAAYPDRLPPGRSRIDVLPTAAALLSLAPALIAAGRTGPAAAALPLYIRDKVAQTTEERAALRAAKSPPP